MANRDIEPIPSPAGLPLVGNISDIDSEFPLGSLMRFAETYGPIVRIRILNRSFVLVSSQELANEVCDQNRFHKALAAALEEVRNGIHDGLFTAYGPQEKNWGIAHRILMPAFGPMSIRSMFDDMHDIASQLVMKWARYGSDHLINVTEDFTRLTLDTLALCAMDFRFNSYYKEDMHPFISAMGDFLTESGNRTRRPAIMQPFFRQAQYKYDSDIALMQATSQEIINARRARPSKKKDLLNVMLEGRDPKTGERLSDQAIINNMITFLIAGHETTSGLLSFVFHYLLKNPQAYQKAQQEVDEVIGTGPVTVEHMTKLPYLAAILRETLRLTPTAPAFSVKSSKAEVIGGKYQVNADEVIVCLLPKIHRDPAVHGESGEAWMPERMLDDNFDKLNKQFPNFWKPFGNGDRACIGRPFAWQEAILILAVLLQSFNFVAEDPSYVLQMKQTLTIKPKDFRMRAILRENRSATSLGMAIGDSSVPKELATPATVPSKSIIDDGPKPSTGTGISIFYGSNTGTCETLARRLASDAGSHGFEVKTVDSLDTAYQRLPRDHPIVIITASYEGQPPDNASHFVSWLEGFTGNEADGVAYSVFGCGHHDWANTFQRVPTLIDRLLSENGANRIVPIGKADLASGDPFTDFETWEENCFWPALLSKYASKEKPSSAAAKISSFGIQVAVSSPRPSTLRLDVKRAKVTDVRLLSATGAPPKRHIEIQLPSDMLYSAGDYLAILPQNPRENVQRAIRRFGLAWDSVLTISNASQLALPSNTPVSATDVFSSYVELAQPATRKDILIVRDALEDSVSRAQLTRLASDEFSSEITAKRVSVLDILDRFPSAKVPLEAFLIMLPPMRVRQYSISSSPLYSPDHCTLTYSVLDQPSFSGNGRFVGVASNYLSNLEVGDTLAVAVRASSKSFKLPVQGENTPIILACAGTGLAPFRGFIQERAALLSAGRSLAPALLFFGCRGPEIDDLYASEFAEWERIGAVQVFHAYSRAPELSKGCSRVQDIFWHERERILRAWDNGAKCYVCGSRDVGEALKEVCIKIAMEMAASQGRVPERNKAEEWFNGIREERYATDVFA